MATTVTTRRRWQERRPAPLSGAGIGARRAVASAWGVTAPFWFAFAGSALILALIWRSLLHIAHADEQTRAAPPEAA